MFAGGKMKGRKDAVSKNISRQIVHRKSKFLPRLFLVLAGCLLISVLTFFTYKIINTHLNKRDSASLMQKYWNVYDYKQVYDISQNIIEKNPTQNLARTLHGYSAFFLGVSQTDNSISLQYIDEAVQNLRIALLNCKEETKPQILYMLGKTYFYKNSFSSYNYYADLVIKYLNEALDAGYRADDISEYLGLSYASVSMTKESIAAFTETLNVRESDQLLLSIARQYIKNGQANIAKQYLFQVLNNSQDEIISEKCHNLLGNIYLEEGSLTSAEKEFNSVIEKNENSADAHYGLGVLYEKRGDAAKARSEWRKTLKIEANHKGATEKLYE